jgi:hypothetical protein
MARRKFRKAFRAAARSTVRYVKKSRKQSSGMSNPLMTHTLPGFIYGGVRQTAKDYASGMTGMLPFGQNNDEVAFGAIGYLLAKNTSGFTSNFGKAMLTVEAASLGHNIVNPMLQGVMGNSATVSTGGVYNY